jgi:RimJ/RimL family protein N-acetyltransferase
MAVELVLTRANWAKRMDFTLITARLTLRPLADADAPSLVRMAVPRVTRGVASISTHWTLDEARDYIAKRQWQGYPGFMLAVEQNGKVIGCVGCGGSPVSVMYFVDPDHWGQGIATEAMSAFLPEVFARFPINRIEADHFEDNPVSGSILERLGFRRTGTEMGHSKGRLEPASVITYAIRRNTFRTAS